MKSGQIVTVEFLGLRMKEEFSFFMFTALLFGIILGAFFMSFSALKYRMRARKANKKIIKMEKEMESLKNTSTGLLVKSES